MNVYSAGKPIDGFAAVLNIKYISWLSSSHNANRLSVMMEKIYRSGFWEIPMVLATLPR